MGKVSSRADGATSCRFWFSIFEIARADCPRCRRLDLDADDGQVTAEVLWLASHTRYGRSVFKFACAKISAMSLELVIQPQSPSPTAKWD